MRVDLCSEPQINQSFGVSLRLGWQMGRVCGFLPRQGNDDEDVPERREFAVPWVRGYRVKHVIVEVVGCDPVALVITRVALRNLALCKRNRWVNNLVEVSRSVGEDVRVLLKLDGVDRHRGAVDVGRFVPRLRGT